MRVDSKAERNFVDLGGRSRLDATESQVRQEQEARKLEIQEAEKAKIQPPSPGAVIGRVVDRYI